MVTLFSGINYFHANQVAKKEVAQKQRDLQEIKDDYNRLKELMESGKKKNTQLKQKIKELEGQRDKFETEVSNNVENYLVKREDLNLLHQQMVEELPHLSLPKGKVVIKENNVYKLVRKEDDPAYKLAQEIAQKVQSTNVEGIYQSLKTRGVPFEDNDWPSKANGAAIGTREYDISMGTNFSGQNPNGPYAAAKDGEAAEYIKRLEDEAKKKAEEEKKKADEEKKKAEDEMKKKVEEDKKKKEEEKKNNATSNNHRNNASTRN